MWILLSGNINNIRIPARQDQKYPDIWIRDLTITKLHIVPEFFEKMRRMTKKDKKKMKLTKLRKIY